MPEVTPPATDPKAPAAPDHAAENAALKAELAALKASKAPPADDPELRDKAKADRDKQTSEADHNKKIESAIKFSLGSSDFIKQNLAILPKDAQDIFTLAEKENYSGPIEKDGAIKSNLVQSFFAVQANVDLLTTGQKSTLDEYLKLTKTEKQNRAQQMYDMVFEPAFEMLKRVKRAEALGKGHGGASSSESEYKNKMMNLSKKHYLGEK